MMRITFWCCSLFLVVICPATLLAQETKLGAPPSPMEIKVVSMPKEDETKQLLYQIGSGFLIAAVAAALTYLGTTVAINRERRLAKQDAEKELTRKRAEFRQSLFVELDDLKLRLAMVVWDVHVQNATFNHDIINWFEPLLASYAGPDDYSQLLQNVRGMKETEDAAGLQAALQLLQAHDSSLNLKKYTLPFLTSQMECLKLFEIRFQQAVLDILVRANLFNQHVDVVKRDADRTFDTSMSGENLDRVKENHKTNLAFIATLAKAAVDRIQALRATTEQGVQEG